MGSFTDYLEDKIIDHIFSKAVFTPVTLYIGLSTTAPEGNGDGFNEPADSGYQRIVTTPADWSNAEDGCIKNITKLCFAMAFEAWGTVTNFGLFDAEQAGKLLVSGVLKEPVTIGTGAIASFEPSELTVSLD